MTDIAQKIEAILFLAGEAVQYSELTRLLKINREELKNYLVELVDSFGSHGLAVLQTDSHVQLVTSASVAEFVAEFVDSESREISAAAAETLAIIAYRGPITRYDIDAIRGVDSRRIVQQLVLRGLILKQPTSGTRAATYVVTAEFLQHIGIADKSQLPDYEVLSQDEKIRRLLEQA